MKLHALMFWIVGIAGLKLLFNPHGHEILLFVIAFIAFFIGAFAKSLHDDKVAGTNATKTALVLVIGHWLIFRGGFVGVLGFLFALVMVISEHLHWT